MHPNQLKKRIKKFIKDIHEKLLHLSDDTLMNFKKVILNELNAKFNNIYEEFNFYFEEILSKEYAFNYRKILESQIVKLKKEDIVLFYENNFINRSTRKIRILEMFQF